jgi:hypothetical protein
MRKRVNCYQCRHYHVTWDPEKPHGCSAMNFKTHMFPAAVVRRESGMPCMLFQPKPRVRKKPVR